MTEINRHKNRLNRDVKSTILLILNRISDYKQSFRVDSHRPTTLRYLVLDLDDAPIEIPF